MSKVLLFIVCLQVVPIVVSAQDMSILVESQAKYVDKMQALKGAGRYDIPVLLESLSNQSYYEGLSPVQERAYLNEVMNILRRMHDPEIGLEEALIELAENEKQDTVVRRYAVQHLALYYARSTRKGKILSALFRFVEAEDINVTALLHLSHLKRKKAAVDPAKFQNALVKAASHESFRGKGQITLLALIGENNVVAALPAVRRWGASSGDPMIVLGAIDVMGKLGGMEDLVFIKEKLEPRNLEYAKDRIEKARRELGSRL